MSDDLRAVWDEIREEYYELSQNKSFAGTYLLLRDIKYLNTRLEIIQKTIDTLRHHRDENLITVLRRYDFTFSFSPETYNADLEAVIIRSQTEALELEQKEEEWKELCKRSDKTQPTHEYFGDWLDAISKYFAFLVRPNKIFVADYCRYCNRLQEEAMKANKKQQPASQNI